MIGHTGDDKCPVCNLAEKITDFLISQDATLEHAVFSLATVLLGIAADEPDVRPTLLGVFAKSMIKISGMGDKEVAKPEGLH